jgi:hypothetical protein
MVCWLFFSFVVLFDFGCCLLVQEMSLVDPYLPYFRQRLITFCIFSLCLLKVSMEISSLPFYPSQVCFLQLCPFCCVLVFSSLFIVQFFGFFLGGSVCQGAMLVYPRGGWGNTVWNLALTCLVWWKSPKQVWSLDLAMVRALFICQCNVVWRSFLPARGSGCQSLILLSALFTPS